jgi:hypothetical protein
LIASVGVATINYALGCDAPPSGGPTSANLMLPISGAPPVAGTPPTSGNLPAPVGGLGGRDDVVDVPGSQGGGGATITAGAAGEPSSGGAGGQQPNGGAAGEDSDGNAGGDSAAGNGGAP